MKRLTLCLILFVALPSFSLGASPIEDYNSSKTYSTGALVLYGQNSYIMSASGTSLGQVPTSNPSVWTDLSIASAILNVPTEIVPDLGSEAILDSLPKSFLSLNANPPAGGNAFGGGSFTGHASYQTFYATANSGYYFSHWSGDASGSSNPSTILLDSNKSITANFKKDYSHLSKTTVIGDYKNTAYIEIYSSLLGYDASSIFDYSALFEEPQDAGRYAQLIDYQVSDLGLSSGKVQFSGAMKIEDRYTTFSVNLDSFATNDDSNNNGIHDYYEQNISYGIKSSGTASFSIEGHGSLTASISAEIHRDPNQFLFYFDETVTIQSSSIAELPAGHKEHYSYPINPIHASGTISFDPSAGTYFCDLSYHGTSGSSSTSGSYSVGSGSSLSFSSLPFPSMGDSSFSGILPALGQKDLYGACTLPYKGSGNFHGMVTIEGIPYFVSITDSNDMDGDGRPNILDPKKTVKSFSEATSLGVGWRYSDWFGYHWINPNWQTTDSRALNYAGGLPNDSFYCWVYHSVFGWIYVTSGQYQVSGLGNGFSAWIYFPDHGWRYTDGLLFPFLYEHKKSSWLYFDSSRSNALYDYSLGEWKGVDDN